MKRRKIRTYKRIGIAAIIVIFLVVVTVTAINGISTKRQESASADKSRDEVTLEYNGKTYEKKTNLQTFLFMGIDDMGKAKAKTEYDGTGQVDTLMLLVRDRSEGTYSILTIDRDTMIEFDNISDDGTVVATTTNQIAMSHVRGDGMEMSCMVTVDAISKFLKNQEIDGYAALNIGGIAVINSAVGGVEVTIDDDFSQVDSTMKQGTTITLTDDQAQQFVRGRKGVGDGTNTNRMKRQEVYINSLKNKMKTLYADNPNLLNSIYDDLNEYMVTNVKKKQFGKIASDVLQGKELESMSIEGTSEENPETGYIEVTADEDSLMETIITLFYKEKK